ncbi:THUMP domain-containing class I SAM-dependent RNA methyltransferase [Aerococcus sp. Group 1]|uniref:THUMP domain-containing class I SAM-dependent RNA methyltransferase n=1 Tax=Aerococcus urinae (strain CCUG 59500 / ACS-120-V-Col10a) TaxID=2976812 RepID=UPI000200E510|nr:class I SAM-dependent RNA methyltransferase [Aerococcus sp. Group 1]AEA00335.1 hypothetical protein HMPREF9243_1001 [Aerococcus sp. Group 1]MCY3031692.1 class I SAM-dependent RNA methyltransferase [Aerococcus sp. Group 1]MCY3055813.1 class I SAM-dependent RNA methyltransferase [Aerococcus sp. Group 1]MCY3057544.1 class I SAM-dependent RNA methyltransferase [Aerococcus sp. Group 1]MCY3062785.1 class I SAM-dependent RNA methyltransferase [Aerococcus sp. Group 1]
MKQYSLIATCASGIEALVSKELKDLGYSRENENGRVRFQGDLSDVAKTNIWLRTADRIKIVMGEFKATTFDQLYEQTKAIAWEDILPLDAEFPVSGKSVKSKLHHVPTCQSMVKKAIVDRLSEVYHRRGHLPETGARYPIEISIHKDKALLTLDSSGTSLFKRGYRQEKGGAPLKETLAAALVDLTTWFPDRPLYDPTTGSGTIAIEAAMKGMNIAPGLKRSFVCEDWDIFPKEVFDQVRHQARAAIDHDIQLEILACDIDHRMIEIAQKNAEAAGVSHQIHFKQMQLADFTTQKSYGIIISNPPYGERLNDEDYVHDLYEKMGEIYRPLKTWSKYILTSDENFESYYGQKATKKRKLYNGALKVDYYQYWGEKRPRNKA